MELKDILALMDKFDASAASGLELELEGVRLKLDKATVCVAAPLAAPVMTGASIPAPAPVQAKEPPKAGDFIVAPLVGTFYSASAPGKPSFASAGDMVKKGQTVCVIEAMKMMSEVPAPADCVIEEVIASDGALVGFDAPLFRVRLV